MKKWLLLLLFSGMPYAYAYEYGEWTYTMKKDQLNDDEYSYAYSRGVKYQYNNYFRIGFMCQNGKVRFEVSADTLIESKKKPFTFTYRVDKRPSNSIQMNTYSNNGQGGYSYEEASQVASDILGGASIFVRAISWNNEYLQTNIPLKASDKNIKRVFSDCGVTIDKATDSKVKPKYTFKDFSSDFEKLSVKKQNELLSKLEKMIGEK
ncbi:hypothetical protein M3906_000287 [Vibrio metschnikovii]|nr:hypothetical protein [Vibrio metschnikovii]